MTAFSTLQDEVLSHQFSDSKYRPFARTQLNRAIRDIARRVDIRVEVDSEDYTTVSGTATAALPSNFARFISLRNTADTDNLEPMELRDYDEANASSGKPTSYVIVGSNITLYPTPDDAYSLTLRYWPFPATLSDDTDESPYTEDYDELLVDYTLSRCYVRENDYEAAQQHKQAYEDGLQRIMGQAQSDTLDLPKQVQGTWAGRVAQDNVWH